jgi:hypothetical protein
MKFGEKYELADAVFTDLQAADAEKFKTVFGAENAATLDIDLYMLAANKTLSIPDTVTRQQIAVALWAKFYDSWVNPTGDLDSLDNMDYSISTTGNSKQTTSKTSNQRTQSDTTGFGSDELVTDGSHTQDTTSNGTIDNDSTNMVIYKGRNGGDFMGDYKERYNFKRAIVNNITTDIIDYITIAVYE